MIGNDVDQNLICGYLDQLDPRSISEAIGAVKESWSDAVGLLEARAKEWAASLPAVPYYLTDTRDLPEL